MLADHHYYKFYLYICSFYFVSALCEINVFIIFYW